jgi:hypothetical protein
MLYGGTKMDNRCFKEGSQYEVTPMTRVLGVFNTRVSCHFLHFAKTEDIWLKSALEGGRGVLLTSGRSSQFQEKFAASVKF